MTQAISVIQNGSGRSSPLNRVAYSTNVAEVSGLVPDLDAIVADYTLRDDKSGATGILRDNNLVVTSGINNGSRFGELPADNLLYPSALHLTVDLSNYATLPVQFPASWTLVYGQYLNASGGVQWFLSNSRSVLGSGFGIRTVTSLDPRISAYIEDGSGGGTSITETTATGVPLVVGSWQIRAISYDAVTRSIRITDCGTGEAFSMTLAADLRSTDEPLRLGRPEALNGNAQVRFSRVLLVDGALSGADLQAMAQIVARDLYVRSREAVARGQAGASLVQMNIPPQV